MKEKILNQGKKVNIYLTTPEKELSEHKIIEEITKKKI